MVSSVIFCVRFEHQSPVCLTSVSALFWAQARHALSALARSEELGFSRYQREFFSIFVDTREQFEKFITRWKK